MFQRVALLVHDGISAFHLSIPFTVFGEDRTDLGLPRFQLTLCAPTPGRIRTSMGFEMAVRAGPAALQRADLVIVPSWSAIDEATAPAVLDGLRAAHRRGKKVVGLCLGAFPVAEAGLLDGRAATTHWAWAERFTRRFPAVALDPTVLYIDHGDVVTSAGTAAGLDCCLHLVRQAYGADVSNRLARRLVIPPHREGGQAQYVEHPVVTNDVSNRLGRTLEWARARLDRPLNIDALADHAAMSRRTFTRHFQRATGTSVTQWLKAQRLQLAQRLLETSDATVARVAALSGHSTPLVLRLAFLHELGTTPGRYRQQFRSR